MTEERGMLSIVPKDDDSEIEAAIDNAVESVVNVIVLKLRRKDPSKFAEAARLCNIGQSLIRSQAKRVEDFAILDDGVDEAQPARAGRYQMGHPQGDQREVDRNNMLTFGPLAQLSAENHRASVATQEATELQNLNTLRATLPPAQRAPVEARIAVLLEHMEVRNNANQPIPEAAVADPDVPRGHPPGEGGAGENIAPGVPANGVGGEGHGGGAFACRINEAAQEVGV